MRKVECLHDRDLNAVVAVRLIFEELSVYMTVNCDDDTICVSGDTPVFTKDERWSDAGGLWSKAVGRRIQWYWEMRNNQGYWDGLQIEFVEAQEAKAPICIQAVTIASRLDMREVKIL